jgi:hypothetical protein
MVNLIVMVSCPQLWFPAHSFQEANASSNALASFRSRVSKPSVKPVVDRREKIMGFVAFALIAPEPRHAHGGAKSQAV